MADEQNTTSLPANRMRLSEKMKKLKSGVKIHSYTEHTEEKGADTQVIEAEHNGNVVGRFVQKDGKTVEASGSADAQQSGEYDKMAQKVGATDDIKHTKPEQVSEIAHDNMHGGNKADNQKTEKVTPAGSSKEHDPDNNHEASKEKFINNKAPKSSEKMAKTAMFGGEDKKKKPSNDDMSVDIEARIKKIPGFFDKRPELHADNNPDLKLDYKNMPSPEPKEPKWKSKFKENQKNRNVVIKSDDAAQPLAKKWSVFMDSVKNKFRDPLKKDPMAKAAAPKKPAVAPSAPQVDPSAMPQHLPSAEHGLETHLSNLNEALKTHEPALLAAQDKAKYAGMTPTERDNRIKMATRSHNYIKQGIDLTKVAIAARDSQNPNWSDLVGTGNPKVNQFGTLTFGNTLPGHHCPARGGCGDGFCYGMNGQQAMGNALLLRARNSGLVHRKDFVQGAIEALKNAPKHMTMTIDEDSYNHIKDHPHFQKVLLQQPVKTDKGIKIKVRAGDTVRWHDTGDILNEKHLDDMVAIAKAFPEKKFYAYTKSLHLPLDKLRALPNFNVIQSFGGRHNDKLDLSKPHAKFFKDLDTAEAAGYSPVWWNDAPAADGVTKLALVPHGSRHREVDAEAQAKNVKVKKSDAPIASSNNDAAEPAWMQYDQPDSIAQSAALGASGKMAAMKMAQHKHDAEEQSFVNPHSDDGGMALAATGIQKWWNAHRSKKTKQPQQP